MAIPKTDQELRDEILRLKIAAYDNILQLARDEKMLRMAGYASVTEAVLRQQAGIEKLIRTYERKRPA